MNVVERLLYNITLEQLAQHIHGLELSSDETILYQHDGDAVTLKREDALNVAGQIFLVREEDGTTGANCYR